ncbi:MAG: thiamine ABC transporter substrate-binding protein [Actinobacteria bacterium]|nr:thiamine ABC transporter substrate-binding protein [Actinomycetota bacterium]
MNLRRLIVVLCALLLSGAWLVGPSHADEPVTITLVTHDSFNASKSVLRAFKQDTDIRVKVLRGGDAGQVVNQAILTKDHPLGDVLYGVDNTFLSRALDHGIFEPYESPELAFVPSSHQLDDRHRVTPIDRADVCVNYDTQWFAEHNIDPPGGITSLSEDAYRGLTVVENPATSSPGLAFMLATRSLGAMDWRTFWTALRENDVAVVDGWEQAWYERFTAVSENGDRPIVVSYASSPVATVPEDGGPARAAVLDGTCFEQIEFAGVLKGTEHRKAARQFVDFLLSEEFQEDMPEQMYVFPVREGAELPQLFVEHADLPTQPGLSIPPEAIEKSREKWIRQWTAIVLR